MNITAINKFIDSCKLENIDLGDKAIKDAK
jgi:hypothetical protein